MRGCLFRVRAAPRLVAYSLQVGLPPMTNTREPDAHVENILHMILPGSAILNKECVTQECMVAVGRESPARVHLTLVHLSQLKTPGDILREHIQLADSDPSLCIGKAGRIRIFYRLCEVQFIVELREPSITLQPAVKV